MVDISAFQSTDQFASLVEELRDYVKSSPPAESNEEVTLPGELDSRLKERRLFEGIPIDEATWGQIATAARSVGVAWSDDLECRSVG